MLLTRSISLTCLILIFATSCSENPERLKKKAIQQAEIQALDADLALLSQKLHNAPADRSDELKTNQSELLSIKTEIESLTQEVSNLELKKQKFEADFKRYQSVYKITKN
jgi:hypothetical protein